ncbi:MULTISPECIES: hypothetical protein [Geomicrobium]|uniref:DUF4190 domain-containing protein n=1 Tax=Geomicrobium sediminis TaxID=1347788 RepID=A0ABS2PE93_9BACL|nr:hypothetical protein [Geomicrobium sp. JCM 19038]MBM7633728.1 hypothetical protein [Geomicrobium sediminis]GAK06465.1 hypothetical protein JCM19038_161 [Geomicrobium sp. JCM 19038]
MADDERYNERPEERREMTDPLIDNYNQGYMEETSAEVSSPNLDYRMDRTGPGDSDLETDEEKGRSSVGAGLGTAAIIMSIVSLFFLPVILGAAGIVTGFFARQQGAVGLGWWAIGIGALSILMTFLFAPFM